MQMMPSVAENYRRQQEEERRAEEEDIARTRIVIRQVKEYYDSFTSYPTSLSDGMHKVKVVDNANIYCFDFEVQVKDNQIVGFSNSEFSHGSAPIGRAAAMLRVRTVEGEEFFWNLYFLDSLLGGK